MTPEQLVERELSIFGREVDAAAQFLYTFLVLNTRAVASRRTLRALNRTPLFWKTVASALQTSAFVTLGRIFDSDRRTHRVDSLLSACITHIKVFSRSALEARNVWIRAYMLSVYQPTASDLGGWDDFCALGERSSVGRWKQSGTSGSPTASMPTKRVLQNCSNTHASATLNVWSHS